MFDKSEFLQTLDQDAGRVLLFLRPRRTGKSLTASMIASFYDINKKHEIRDIFAVCMLL